MFQLSSYIRAERFIKAVIFLNDGEMMKYGDVDGKKISKKYWENSLPQHLYSKYIVAKKGTINYYRDTEEYRYYKHFPYMLKDCEFDEHKDDKVLEVGCGIGTDFVRYAKGGCLVYGIDLTENSIIETGKRLVAFELKGNLQIADAEYLPFKDNFFDLVYSSGVLHHTPNTDKAIYEIYRVLKPRKKAIIYLYRKGWMYYIFFPLYFGIIKGDLFGMSWNELIHKHYEIKGNVPVVKVYSKKDMKKLFKRFEIIELKKRPLLTSIGEKIPNKWLVKQLEKISGGLWLIKVKKK